MPNIVYSHPIEQEYRTAGGWWLSRANIFQVAFWEKSKRLFLQVLSIAVIIVVPYVIAYASGDLWKYTSTYNEQPKVHYRHEYALFFGGNFP